MIPANLKNGKCSYKKTDIGFFKINANITIKINPTDITNSLEKPLLNPTTIPDIRSKITATSNIFISSPNIIIL